MANFMDFTSSKIDIGMILLDESGSMEKNKKDVRRGVEGFQQSFEGFPNANSIVVNVSTFSTDFYPGEFRQLRDFNYSYRPYGWTALHYSIVKSSQLLKQYIKDVIEHTNIVPQATFVVVSDGEPAHDPCGPSESMKEIQSLNYAHVTTVFVACGKAIRSEFGRKLGFQSTKDIRDKKALTEFFAKELSQSFKTQSERMRPLGANFFSKAGDASQSSRYSKVTEQVLEDDSWIDDI